MISQTMVGYEIECHLKSICRQVFSTVQNLHNRITDYRLMLVGKKKLIKYLKIASNVDRPCATRESGIMAEVP
jgi:hypothetical protein